MLRDAGCDSNFCSFVAACALLSTFVGFSRANVNYISILHVEFGGFHLHLLVFPFVYQSNSRIVALVCSSFAND